MNFLNAAAGLLKIPFNAAVGDVARDAIQVCGGYGFIKELAHTGQEYPLEAIYRDSKIGEIYEGANEIQKMIIARQIFGRLRTSAMSSRPLGSLKNSERMLTTTSLGAIYLQPLWVFRLKGTGEAEELGELKGRRIASGWKGSSARMMALIFLDNTGTDDEV